MLDKRLAAEEIAANIAAWKAYQAAKQELVKHRGIPPWRNYAPTPRDDVHDAHTVATEQLHHAQGLWS